MRKRLIRRKYSYRETRRRKRRKEKQEQTEMAVSERPKNEEGVAMEREEQN